MQRFSEKHAGLSAKSACAFSAAGKAFLHLTKQTVPWPTGLCLMLVEFIPDNSEEKDTFCQIELDARPFINRLSQVTVLGDPVGKPFAEWYVNKTAPL